MKSLLLGVGVSVLAGVAEAAVPPNFTDTLVTTVPYDATALAFTPDGRLLITVQDGNLRIFQGGSLLPTPAITFGSGGAPPICDGSGEEGLLGVAVDPSFSSNHFIYLYYTANISGVGCKNRTSRFTLPPSNIIDPASELILIDRIETISIHNGGDVHFGNDGYLYVSVGDGGSDARNLSVLNGKILRITSDGQIPPTNPFQGPGTARCNVTGGTTPGTICQETFAWGLRNPFRIAFDPNAARTRFFINDVGQSAWEEIDRAQSGGDYGWYCREGAHTYNTSGACNPTPPDMIDPIFEYAHNQQLPGTTSPPTCNVITGGAFVPNGLWPGYDGTYLFSDFGCGWIFRLTAGPPYTAADFATNLGSYSVVTLQFGPFGKTQALYYTTFSGEIRRITFTPTPVELQSFVVE